MKNEIAQSLPTPAAGYSKYIKCQSFIISTTGEHYDVTALVSLHCDKGEIQSSDVQGIEVCASEEAGQAQYGPEKLDYLFRLCGYLFTNPAVDTLRERLEAECMTKLTDEEKQGPVDLSDDGDDVFDYAEDRRVEDFVQAGMDRRAEGY